jgi:hypothetical protein
MKKLAAALLLTLALALPAGAERISLTLYHLQDVAKINQAVEDSASRFMADHEGRERGSQRAGQRRL